MTVWRTHTCCIKKKKRISARYYKKIILYVYEHTPQTSVGSRWKFVGDSSPQVILKVGAFATQIAILLLCDSLDKQYEVVGICNLKLSPGVGSGSL